ncbi:MAG TPA: tail fiber protein [Candidatus Angelobacter sp.]|jgi:microcystin-dependent protein|nr:tail fiber protein [Candidatus Angelobacter sp.]
MANPFVAEIRIFTGNFAPKGWALCNGQILPISQNTALFSLLGTTYGGDGKSNFALPNLQGSAPMQQGQGPGLSLRDLGEIGGEQTVTLLQTEMPSHSHSAQGSTGSTQTTPVNNAWASGAKLGGGNLYFPSTPASNVQMSPFGTSIAGGNLPHNNMPPFLGLTFIIALQGVFPARS